MAASLVVEDERGTYTQLVRHPHNGYYAGDFSSELTVSVQGAGEALITANTAKAQELLELAGVNDVQVPAQLDGAKITVRKPAAVILDYKLRNRGFTLMQSPSPEIELPPGVELKQLGEIGLRVLGLSPDDARNFANSVDWSSTFLVPIRADAAEVRQVNVNGAEGLMLTTSATAMGDRNPRRAGDAGSTSPERWSRRSPSSCSARSSRTSARM